jgi:hypothetical protein
MRFVRAINDGADLLFSKANGAELSGPSGDSADVVRAFLNELGPHWFPAELSTIEVVKRELAGESPKRVCVARDFLVDYLSFRMKDYNSGCGKIIDLSELVRLGAILDWVGPQRESIRNSSVEMDETLRKVIAKRSLEHKNDATQFERNLPAIPFDATRPACFAYSHLLRGFVESGHSVKKNDGLDFSHALMGAAFAHIAALDTRWKHRIESLPKPNGLASVYCSSELNQLVDELEAAASSCLS